MSISSVEMEDGTKRTALKARNLIETESF